MSNLSAYASNFLSARQGQGQAQSQHQGQRQDRGRIAQPQGHHPPTSTSTSASTSSSSHYQPYSPDDSHPAHNNPFAQIASNSHFQFDPLLRSTFGHRSADLYGSRAYDDQDDDGDDGEDDEEDDADPFAPALGRRQSRSTTAAPGMAGSSLINASRYGHVPVRTHGHDHAHARGVIPEVATEDDADADADAPVDEAFAEEREEDRERQWGRGLNMRAFDRSSQMSDGDGTIYGAEGSRLLASSARSIGIGLDDGGDAMQMQGTVERLGAGAESVDPFLVEDDHEHEYEGEDQESGYRDQPHRASEKGKARDNGRRTAFAAAPAPAPAPTPAPRRDLSGGRGWLAHSIAPNQRSSPGRKVRPPRDAYSIYDDEDAHAFSSEGDSGDDDDDDDDESEASDEGQGQDQVGRGTGTASMRASTMHYPTKMSASSFPRPPSSVTAAADDDFHKRLPTRDGGPEESMIVDSYRYPRTAMSLGSHLASWKPWAAGNNPSWREWKDQGALIVWGGALLATVVLAGGVSLGVSSPSAPSTPAVRPSPYYTLTRSLPLLILLSTISLVMAVLNLAFLRNLDRLGGAAVLRAALIGTPSVLCLGWIWAFAGSFLYDDEQWSGGTWSTTGLRFISLFPLLCAVLFSRLLWLRQAQLAKSISVLSLSARIISAHPTLLVLSLAHVVLFLLLSIPFLTIFIRLFLLGHFSAGDREQVWITDSRARLLAWLTLGTWLWTWAALRGVMRVVVSSVVSHWYFHGPPSKDDTADEDEEAQLGGGGFAAGFMPRLAGLAAAAGLDVGFTAQQQRTERRAGAFARGDAQTEPLQGDDEDEDEEEIGDIEDEDEGDSHDAHSVAVEESDSDLLQSSASPSAEHEDDGGLFGAGDSQAGPSSSQAPSAWPSRSAPAVAPAPASPSASAQAQDQLSHRNPTARDIVRASFLRATGPSLGTILLSALLLALSRLLLLLSSLARYLAALLSSPSVPSFLHPLAHVAYLLSGAGGVIKGVSDYTLVYAGITGKSFWVCSRRCGRIVGRRGVKGVMEGLLITSLLSLLTLSLSFLAALAGFLFSAHSLHVPADAPLVGLLCGIVPFWVLRLAADVLANGADTLYLCYAIDAGGAGARGGAGGGAGEGEGVGAKGGPRAQAQARAQGKTRDGDRQTRSETGRLFA